jgi:hypothetical protein
MLAFLTLAALGGNMMASAVANDGRADVVFRTGPEYLVAASRMIITGPVSGYTKDVRKYSGPGPDGYPLEWIASGRIDQSTFLKGNATPGSISFSRSERSVFTPEYSETPVWEQDFGEISPAGQVVVFLSGENSPESSFVLPSGSQEQDLVALVKGIVAIQAIPDPTQQRQAWLQFLTNARSDEARRVALRSLVHGGAGWNEIAPSLKTLFSHPNLSRNMKVFAFGLVTFYVTEGRWAKDSNAAIDLLCQAFAVGGDPKLEIQYLQGFKTILNYTAEEPAVESRKPLHRKIMETLEQQEARGVSDPALKEEYRRIHAQYGNP